jgi:uncharacterized membrane protein YkvA (DUF1232 family)
MKPENSSSQVQLWRRVQNWGRLLFKKETPWRAKAIIAFAILYFLSPFDLIPDWIIGLGLLDDLTLVSILVAWAVRIAEKHNKT